MKTKLHIGLSVVLILVVLAAALPAIGQEAGPANNILREQYNVETGRQTATKWRMPVSQSVLYAVLESTGDLASRADQAAAQRGPSARPVGAPSGLDQVGTVGCPQTYTGRFNNVRMNQDCSLRRQAEEVIAINPTNEKNMIGGQNDSRIGFNACGYDFTFNGGNTWGDMNPPFYQFLMADGHTSDACSDPTATFDSQGNAYVGGVLFDINSPASAFVTAKSNAPLGGSFYHTPANLSFQEYRTTPLGVIASDNDPDVFHDKEFIVSDSNPGSPKANNVYATWTRFATTNVGVGANSPIYFSQSTDGGATWSLGIEISGINAALCTAFSGSSDPNACDQDQGSHPIVGPDGTLYVAFGNGNLPGFGVEQVLMVSCPAAADCSNSANWTAPAKVGDMFELHPVGPSAEGCPAGRQCLPPNGYRVPMITSISASAASNGNLFVSWTDGRNLGANCQGAAATATPPCDSDIFYAYSTDGGTTWSSSFKLTPAGSAQWQSWSAVTANGNVLWVAYYDRSFGNCEFDGCNDITLVKIKNPASGSPKLSFYRLTTSSMPNLTPANNPVQAGFLGDYMWLTVDSKGRPHVAWADTRGRNGTVEEDVCYAQGPLPSP
jgi:hypothetical protein